MTGDELRTDDGPGDLRRARFVVSYLGSSFRGVAPNAGVRTVVGVLGAEMERVVRRPLTLTVAGRTDAGVHAWGQVVSVDLPATTDLDDLCRRLNRLCAPDIAVREGSWTEPGFDARFSATWRRYRYHVWNDPAPNPLVAATVWHVPSPLDLGVMERAASDFVGEHDFASFCRRERSDDGRPEAVTRRIVHEVGWRRIGTSALLRFSVRGSAFCQQQVRSMVGTLVDVGLGRIAADRIPAILTARDRAVAGRVAPPDGLVLWDVGYDGRRWDDDHLDDA